MNSLKSVGGVRLFGRCRALRWLALGLLLLPQPLLPATIPVSGTCTLVDAIKAANNDDDSGGLCPPGGSGADTLALSGNVSLTVVDGYDPYFIGATGLPLVTSDVTVDGGGFVIERDGAAPNFRIFFVASSGTLTLNDTTVRNGSAYDAFGFMTMGGGIGTRGGAAVRLTNSHVVNNRGFNGGGIFASGTYYSRGTLTLANSTVSGNVAARTGGGISTFFTSVTATNSTIAGNTAVKAGGTYVGYGPLDMSDSTVSGNVAAYYGGGVLHIGAYSTAKLTNSTVSGNAGGYFGGGLYLARDVVDILHSTVSGNSARYGGGIQSFSPSVRVANTIVADSPSGGDCAGAIIDGGNNFDDDGSCPGTAPIVPGVDFDATLASNGGPTQTHALLAGSVAQDAAGVCGLAADQRGVPRSDGACDSGSFELVAAEGACCTDGAGIGSDCVTLNQSDCEAGGGLFLGAGTECADILDCVPLVTIFESMSAEGSSEGVSIRWSTSTEVDTVAFRVLRESPEQRIKVTAQVGPLVPGVGHALAGGSYEVLDDSPAAARALHYFIEDIDVFGRVTRHGPIAVDRGVRQAPGLRARAEGGL